MPDSLIPQTDKPTAGKKPYRSPAEIIAEVIVDARDATDGVPRIGRVTRKRAQRVLDALQAEGWRVLR